MRLKDRVPLQWAQSSSASRFTAGALDYERERAVHDALAELRMVLAVVLVEMQPRRDKPEKYSIIASSGRIAEISESGRRVAG